MGICRKCLGRVVFQIGDETLRIPTTREPPARCASEPASGRRYRNFGDYELQEEIARGGMGVVWRARQRSLDRPVALKMILAGHLASEEEVERFQREAHAAAALDHPNIVAIYEVGQFEGQPYFSMQLMEGASVGQILRARQQQLAEGKAVGPCGLLDSSVAAARLMATVARAVHHAHQRGILHRDLKPDNILLDSAGEPRVTDFGLARYLDQRAELTRLDRVMGTPYYVSPEQARGERGLTTAADIYSLGAVLYHLLTGQPVAQANTAWETLRAVVEREPPWPGTVNTRADRDLGTICMKCLEKDPQRRYASANALAEDLERWLRGEPILARRTAAWERTLKWCRRKPVVAALAGALVVVVILGMGGTIRYARQSNVERLKEQQASRDAVERLWGAYLAQARAHRWSHRSGQRFDSLTALSNAAAIRPTLELRNEAIAAMALPDARVLRYWQLKPPVPLFAGLVFDAAVKRYARAYPDGQIAICQALDDVELLRLPGFGPWHEAALCFSPDGRFLAEKHDSPNTNVFCVWNLERNAPVLVLPWSITQLPFAFTPDGAQIAVARGETVCFFELRSGGEVRRIQAPFAPAHLRFDLTGRKLAICIDSRPELVVLDAASGAVLQSFDAKPTGCAWNFDGSRLASACADSQVYVWDVGNGKLQATLKGHTAAAMTVVSSPTSDLLASSGWDGNTRLWDAVTQEHLFSLPGDLIWFSPPSPGDQRLGFHVGDHHAGIWELAPARECLRWPAAGVACATFDASGQVLITANREGVTFWDAERRRLLEHLPIGDCCAIERAADGKSLFTAGNQGVQRRAFQFDSIARRVRLGTVESLWPDNVAIAALSPNGRALVARNELASELAVLNTEFPGELLRINTPAQGMVVTISSDGKRLAISRWHGRDVAIWDVSAGKLETVLAAAEPARGVFSPDGQYLAIGSPEDYQDFRTDSWQRVFRLPRDGVEGGFGAIQFSPDSSILAVATEQLGHVRLLATGSWHELATLEEGTPLCFSADGAKLAVYSAELKAVMIWDLRLVRRQLAAMGLDWGGVTMPADGR
jgi:WD40 repeat protein